MRRSDSSCLLTSKRTVVMTFALVEAARDRSAVGRGILVTLAGAVVSGGLLVAQLGRVAAPGEVETPTGSGADHRLVIAGDAYGQCHIAARINGLLFRSLLLDSGASGHLTFGRNDAARILALMRRRSCRTATTTARPMA